VETPREGKRQGEERGKDEEREVEKNGGREGGRMDPQFLRRGCAPGGQPRNRRAAL